MTIPVILFTGFLGSGKTTVINRLLQGDHGRCIAAIVNDFGAVNIDANLIETAEDNVIGLANGCICCTLQGDFLRTAKGLLSRTPQPDLVVIEASGIAEPQGIVEMIQDPMMWNTLSLDAILCVVDVADVAEEPARMSDPLWRVQVEQADFLLLTKSDLVSGALAKAAMDRLTVMFRKPLLDTDREALPLDLLDPRDRTTTSRALPASRKDHSTRFEAVEWQSDGPVPKAAFQAFLHQLAPSLLRAKGFLSFTEKTGRTSLLQLAGRRATLKPYRHTREGCQLVLIGEKGDLDALAILQDLNSLAFGPADRLETSRPACASVSKPKKTR